MPVRPPNPWGVACFALATGACLGAATAIVQAPRWQVGDFLPGVTAADAPRAETIETVHRFGSVAIGGTGSHEFTIRNGGRRPLKLTKGATSCTCTLSDFSAGTAPGQGPEHVVAPGDTARVTVQWHGRGNGGPFRQQAVIFTDDPRRPEIVLVVEGLLVPRWKVVPATIALPGLTTNSADEALVKILTYGTAAPAVTTLSIDGPEPDRFFTLAASPLAPTDLSANAGATGGLLLRVGIRPGLPLGPLRRTITAALRLPEEVLIDIPVEGVVSGDLALGGPNWDSSRQMLALGTVSGRSGLQTQLFLTARGPSREQVRPVVREVVPASLKVEVGSGQPIGSAPVIRIPITIKVPAGAAIADHLADDRLGSIVLDTGHPDSPTLTIPVRLAVEH
ncbi:MAG: DUF1573 domain-containing protein [Planctomycetia bacterium]|jgi:hypothetical protein